MAIKVSGTTVIDGSRNIINVGNVDGRDVSVDGSKLDGIEAGATGDQTASEIKTAYESNIDTNVYTDAEKTKLNGIETGATADQTSAEIRALIEAATDSNVFTDADHTKLNGIAAGAQVNVATNLSYTTASTTGTVTSSTGTNATLPAATTTLAGLLTGADKTKLNGIATGAQVNVATNLGITNGTTAGPIITSSTGTNATFPTASATISGAITTGNQTFAGIKTFAGVNTSSANITGGSISGITDLAIADGGTGASSASAARTNLGLVIGVTVQGFDANTVKTDAVQTLTNKNIVRNVEVIAVNTNADASVIYVITADLTLTLPATPTVGSQVHFSNRSELTTPVIARNGSNIMGVAEDLTLDNVNAFGTLVFADATRGWIFQ